MATGGAHRLELGAVSGNGAVTAITKAAVEARGGSMQTETGRVDGAAEIANCARRHQLDSAPWLVVLRRNDVGRNAHVWGHRDGHLVRPWVRRSGCR